MKNKVWKNIEGYEGIYQISNCGEIKALKRLIKDIINNKYPRKRVIKQKILKAKTSKQTGYKQVVLLGKTYNVHKLVANAFIGKGGYVNHKDFNKTNNNIENLEVVDSTQNVTYRRKQNKKTFSKYKGVTFDKCSKKWIAQIMYKYKHVHLGRFFNEDEAALAYNKKAKELFGDYVILNTVFNEK
jgi:hypothetical protein